MTFRQWLWSPEFWILAAPMTILFLGLYIWEEAVDVKKRSVDVVTILFALISTAIFYIFIWVVTA